MPVIGRPRPWCRLDRLDLGRDVLGGFGGLFGEFFDLVGDDGEALAGFAGAGGLDGGVEGEEVGLLGDAEVMTFTI
jgi:hypothetical protein